MQNFAGAFLDLSRGIDVSPLKDDALYMRGNTKIISVVSVIIAYTDRGKQCIVQQPRSRERVHARYGSCSQGLPGMACVDIVLRMHVSYPRPSRRAFSVMGTIPCHTTMLQTSTCATGSTNRSVMLLCFNQRHR